MKRLAAGVVVVVAVVLWAGIARAADAPKAAPAAAAAAPAGGGQTEAAQKIPGLAKDSPLNDPKFFPIGVWAQQAKNAAAYAALGVNVYFSIGDKVTADVLATLKKGGVYVICHQDQETLAFKDDRTILGWMHGDEPDNFTRKDANSKWEPKRKPDQITADCEAIKKADPTRPVVLNLGQGVANIGYKGGWAKDKDYAGFLASGCDIVSYDIYPACSDRAETKDKLWLVSEGVDRLIKLGEGRRVVWFITEASQIRGPKIVTPLEMKAEVWMALVHGATGIAYFCHQWEPKKDFAFPLHDEKLGPAMKAINAQVQSLAPVLNSPTVAGGATVESSKAEVPVDCMVKKADGAAYVFAVAMRSGETKATFTVKDAPGASAEVIGENRKIEIKDGKFADDFKAWDVHLYKIAK